MQTWFAGKMLACIVGLECQIWRGFLLSMACFLRHWYCFESPTKFFFFHLSWSWEFAGEFDILMILWRECNHQEEGWEYWCCCWDFQPESLNWSRSTKWLHTWSATWVHWHPTASSLGSPFYWWLQLSASTVQIGRSSSCRVREAFWCV